MTFGQYLLRKRKAIANYELISKTMVVIVKRGSHIENLIGSQPTKQPPNPTSFSTGTSVEFS